MARTPADSEVRSEDPTRHDISTDARQASINRQIGNDWLDLGKHVAWHGGYKLDQVICRQNEGGWQLILKAWRRGRPYAAYWQAETLSEAFDYGGQVASKGLLEWELDKYPSKWLKDTLGIKQNK